MVCEKCTKKLSKVAAPDPFSSAGSQVASGSRRIGENKLLTKAGGSKSRYTPYGGKCKDCKQNVSQNTAKYCHGCAYKKGICSICGKKILDTTGYVMSSK
ncbi:PDZ-binding protein [Gautieria morchelliformis]|nr:PDZ-binding protein [Gautieria morchelliformis]